MPSRCRVLFVVQYLGLSGAELRAIRLLQRLDPERFTAGILHYYPATEAALREFARIERQRVFVDRRAARSYCRWLGRMVRETRQFRPDVIVCFGSTCAAYGRAAGAINGVNRFVVVVCDVHPPAGPLFKCAAWLFRGVRRQLHIGLSGAVCDVIHKHLHIPREKIRCVYNGVDLEDFKRTAVKADVRATLGAPDGAPLVLCVASLNAYKNHRMLLRAAGRVVARCPQCVFLLVGQDAQVVDDTERLGPKTSNLGLLKSLAAEMGLEKNIVFAGPREDIPDILASTDVFVMPSWNEGLNSASIEAMAMEVPVVATSVGGLPEVVEDGKTGYLVASDNDEAMAARILELLGDRVKREAFGNAGRQRAERLFAIEQMVDAYSRIIEEVWHAGR